jgi:hypothetical protein
MKAAFTINSYYVQRKNHSFSSSCDIVLLGTLPSSFQGEVEPSISWYQSSVESQDDWPQFHHICYWELYWANTYAQNWSEAARYARMLYDESKWSRCSYAYQTAATMCMMEEGEGRTGLSQDLKKQQIEHMKYVDTDSNCETDRKFANIMKN